MAEHLTLGSNITVTGSGSLAATTRWKPVHQAGTSKCRRQEQ